MNITFVPDTQRYTVAYDGFTADDLKSFLAPNGVPVSEIELMACEAKHRAQSHEVEDDRLIVARLLNANCVPHAENKILFSEVYERLRPDTWSRVRFSRALPSHLKPIAGTGHKKYVFNLAWTLPLSE